MSKQNAPALRLEGFSGEWEKTTLGELGAFRSGVGFPEREQGGTIGLPFYKVSDLSAPGNELQLQSANHYVTEGQIVRNHWTPVTAVPAILFAKVGAAVFLGRKRLVNNAFLLDNNLMAFSLNTESWDVQFADTYLKTVDLTQFTQSGALPSLNARHLAEAEAIIPPTLEEQQAIGAIFTNLDAAINQHTLKHKALQQAKTALMQRMFPQEGQTVPELRLKGFSGEWEDCTLGEHSHVTTGSSDVQDADPDGLYPFFVRSQHVERSNKYLFDGEAILIPGEGRLGEIFHYYIGKFDFHQRVYRISDFEDIDGKYVYWAMQHSFKDHAMKNTVKATVDSLRQPTITGFIFQKPPTLEEQQAIGAVFTNLDQLIVAEARYIKSLKQAKTALLQRMFI